MVRHALSYHPKLFQDTQDRGERFLPEPGDPQPESVEHKRAIDAIDANLAEPIAPICAELIELGLFAQWIDEPIFAHTSGLVFNKLVAAVAPDALRRDDLDDQIGRAIEECRLNKVCPLLRDKENIRLAPAWSDAGSHNKRRDSHPASLMNLVEHAQDCDQELD